MSSTYSPSLRLELIGPGEQAGTWNTTTNTNLGTLIDTAVAGNVTVSVTSANQALTANDGASDQARQAIITLTTTTGAAFAIYAPPVAKEYIINNTSAYNATIYNSTVLGNTTPSGAGATIPAGKKATVFSAGAGFFLLDSLITPEAGVLAVLNGGTGVSTSTGSGNTVLSNSPTLVNPNLGTPSTLVGTNISGTAANLNIGGTAQFATTTATATNATTATQIVTGSGWTIAQSGANLDYNYNGVNSARMGTIGGVAGLSVGNGTGNFICNIAYSTTIECLTRINVTGNLEVGQYAFFGTTSFFASAGGKVNIQWDPTNTQGITMKASNTTFNGNAMAFLNSSNGISGVLQQQQNSLTLITASDYRLKNSITPMTGALAKVALLKPCTFKWNFDNTDGQGFIAHELQEVVKDCVSGTKDQLNEDGSIKAQGIDQSKLVATLTAAIQELKALIDTQAARITALEFK